MLKKITDGRLIVLEGIDGSGKTTQCRRLADTLKKEGWDVVVLREPTDGPHGKKIRELAAAGRDQISPEEELDLFLKDRQENVKKNIQPALKRGQIVLMDRYYYSTIAYQGALGLSPQSIREKNEEFAPPADLLLYLQIPAELAKNRIEGNRKDACDLFERQEYLEKVKGLFDAMTDPQMERIDASQDAETVFNALYEAVMEFLDKEELEEMLEELNESLSGLYFDPAALLEMKKGQATLELWEAPEDAGKKSGMAFLTLFQIQKQPVVNNDGLVQYNAMRYIPETGLVSIETDKNPVEVFVSEFEVELED